MSPEDMAVVRRIVTARRAAGWRHAVYGIRGDHEHLYWSSADIRHAEKVIVDEGLIEHKALGEVLPDATLRPHNAAEVEGWLGLLGLPLPAGVTS